MVEEQGGIIEYYTCSVRNCGAKIEPGKEIRVGEQIYCSICGVAMLKAAFPIFER
ncbi:MAG TPA: hypothetical protein VKK79_23185 [Candidatus Lokiarchaeia archaeon]|nr:hypothetical protein [Candidatus Lokiarchaeia archaeon]